MPPCHHLADYSLGYFFGGFGGMLALAAIVSIICYKPLGDPNPDSSNLALGILLIVVICIQGVFNAWQDWVCNLFILKAKLSEQFKDHGEYYQNDTR